MTYFDLLSTFLLIVAAPTYEETEHPGFVPRVLDEGELFVGGGVVGVTGAETTVLGVVVVGWTA